MIFELPVHNYYAVYKTSRLLMVNPV